MGGVLTHRKIKSRICQTGAQDFMYGGLVARWPCWLPH
jgi:hypothetical protein